MADRDYTPYQQRIIKRYYDKSGDIQLQRLSELATELYLAEADKKKDRLWKQVSDILARLELPEARVQHILTTRDPALLPALVQELEKKDK